MKNAFIYQFVGNFPIFILTPLYIYGYINSFIFMGFILPSGLLFRPMINYIRVQSLGLLGDESFFASYFQVWKLVLSHYSTIMFENGHTQE